MRCVIKIKLEFGCDRIENFLNFCRHKLAHFFVGDILAHPLGREGVSDVHGCFHAKVSLNENIFEFL